MNLNLLLSDFILSRHVTAVLSIWRCFTRRVYERKAGLHGRRYTSGLYISIGLFACLSCVTIASDNLLLQDKIIPIGSDYHNSIEILNNRFRVDGDVNEVTIIFFRAFGSPPIVLVRPDGSKLFLEKDLEDDSFNWFETDTYDMISLSNPMPGPWQAIGDILPESRVMVIAGITLHAEPIPSTIFSGETIKQTAFLENAGSRIDMSEFRDVVSLSIEFVSTNNPNYPNFGLGSRPIARFEDDGLGFDEYEADGTFTGQFDLKISEGEYKPIFTVRTPLFSREQINDNIILYPTPINVSHIIDANEQNEHILNIGVDPKYIAATGFVVDGSVRHPNGETEKFSLTERSTTERSLTIANSDYGIYKINMTVFAKALDGRDLVLSIPEYLFVTAAPEIVVEAPTVPDIQVAVLSAEVNDKAANKEPESFLVMAIIVNLVFLLVGFLILALIVNKRKHPHNHFFLRMQKRVEQLMTKQSKIDNVDAKV